MTLHYISQDDIIHTEAAHCQISDILVLIIYLVLLLVCSSEPLILVLVQF